MKYFVLSLGIMGMITGCSMRPKSFEGVVHARPQAVASLIGQSRTQIHSRFGVPTLSRTEKTQSLWSYQSDSCALLIYFDKIGVCQYAETRGKCQ
ncbi:MAG: hypothetical protein IKV03_00480 [Alphaproteobacteria bacterium]|nr:hypothetical protein [Alphaproteobacteria bacterium]